MSWGGAIREKEQEFALLLPAVWLDVGGGGGGGPGCQSWKARREEEEEEKEEEEEVGKEKGGRRDLFTN